LIKANEPRQPKTRATKRKAAFLRAFEDSGSVTHSALLAGIDPATHCDWLATDARYKAAFEAAIPLAAGALEDGLIRLALVGVFEPIVYQGEFQYAARKRTLCRLADGSTAFEDELAKGALVTERRTVTTRDGEMLGVYRPDAGLLKSLVERWMPEKYGTSLSLMPEKYCTAPRFTVECGAIRIIGEMEPGQLRTRLTNRQSAFLRAFRDSCSVTNSALLAGIDRATHYAWLAQDARYKAAFEAAIPEAAGLLEDALIRWARVGLFEPFIYKGEFQYAARRRTICKLADGTTAFEDELPRGARVTERRTVTTLDGEMLGVYRRDARLLEMLLAAWMPEKYGDALQLMPEKYPDRAPTRRIIYPHTRDGKPAGSSVIGPDGRHVWWEPPEGSKKGEAVGDGQNSTAF
jgi:hypothetical protein